jgi:oligopeptide transport system ATP-binding protein
MNKILEVNNLKVSYHTYAGEIQSVRGVSFDLCKGETLAIVGESGCGKTVTAKSLLRLIQAPQGEIKKGSEIKFNNKDILSMSKNELRQLRGGDISMIFQDPMTSLNPTAKIGDQIAESLIIHRGLSKRDAHKEAIRMLE